MRDFGYGLIWVPDTMSVSPSEGKTSAEDATFSAFISYSTAADKKMAFEITEYLEGLGLKCWIAPRNVRPGWQYASEACFRSRDCEARCGT